MRKPGTGPLMHIMPRCATPRQPSGQSIGSMLTSFTCSAGAPKALIAASIAARCTGGISTGIWVGSGAGVPAGRVHQDTAVLVGVKLVLLAVGLQDNPEARHDDLRAHHAHPDDAQA